MTLYKVRWSTTSFETNTRNKAVCFRLYFCYLQHNSLLKNMSWIYDLFAVAGLIACLNEEINEAFLCLISVRIISIMPRGHQLRLLKIDWMNYSVRQTT